MSKRQLLENEKLIKKGLEPIQISYDFKFVWFPSRVNFHGYTFNAPVYFCNATFTRGVEFGIAKFHYQAQFNNANFLGVAIFADAIFFDGGYFLETKFSSDTYFSKSKFIEEASFSNSKFLGMAYFREAEFLERVNFYEAIFDENAYFTNAKFLRNSNNAPPATPELPPDVDFSKSKFAKDTFFHETEFYGKVTFYSAVFGKDSDIFFRKAIFENEPNFDSVTSENSLTFEKLRLSENCILNLQNTAFERASRVVFKSLNLRPNWFVNSDPRKFVFHDVDWGFEKGINQIIFNESNQLVEERKITERPLRLLTITSRQLAENAENSNRYEEASKFRQMAFEYERLQRKDKISKWWNEGLYKCWIGFIKKCPEKAVSFPYNAVHWAYRWTSGYGEKPLWATIVLLLFVLLLFPIIFMFCEFQSCDKTKPLLLSLTEDREKGECRFNKIATPNCNCRRGGLYIDEAISYSLATATLQTVEYRTPTRFLGGGLWTILEKIFAPLQAALLALAIRRKFMR